MPRQQNRTFCIEPNSSAIAAFSFYELKSESKHDITVLLCPFLLKIYKTLQIYNSYRFVYDERSWWTFFCCALYSSPLAYFLMNTANSPIYRVAYVYKYLETFYRYRALLVLAQNRPKHHYRRLFSLQIANRDYKCFSIICTKEHWVDPKKYLRICEGFDDNKFRRAFRLRGMK